ncbi:bacterioferritin [Maribrevibacterium harenarium]|uniref:Bacterioferritin-associated ferredoxin n=1 Tax=Maribrevibacterium harenarium TaxID=2589817 RepID=A0A501WHS0_9GAMM|nr:(2Fe-2S)-binding protein [Maribrevibacterium harenarium]TPE48908.1 bacterioferritin [Maribrevibacterium harenarium]
MYVCICYSVKEKDIKQSVAQGAHSMRDLYTELELGRQCGKCCQTAKQILNEELAKLAYDAVQVA